MAKTYTAPFAQTPKVAAVTLTTATVPAGTTATKLLTAGTDGAIVTRITAIANGTITATGLVLYVANAGVKFVTDSAALPAYTYAATAKFPSTAFTQASESEPIRLGAGQELWVGTLVTAAAPGIDIVAEYTDF